jgi:hypothetical protein
MEFKVGQLVLAQNAAPLPELDGAMVDFIGRLESIDGDDVVVRAYDGEAWPSKLSALKQVVHYDVTKSFYVAKGNNANVFAIDHPDPSIFPNEWVTTSVVKEVDPYTGFFETRNTLYMASYVAGVKSPYLP